MKAINELKALSAAPGEQESAYQRGYMDGMAKGRRDAEAAPQQEVPTTPDDPLDWPLPCDIKAGGVTISKGCPLSTVQTRLEVQAEANALLMRRLAREQAAPQAPQQEAQEPWGYARKTPGCGWHLCSKRHHEEAVADGHETKKLYTAPQPAPAPLSDDVVKDAARYRWLIDQHWIQTEVDWRLISTHQDSTIKQLDAAIDAARARLGGKT